MFRVIISNFFNFYKETSSPKKYPFYFLVLIIFFTIYVLVVNQIKSHSRIKENSFNSFVKSNEFANIKTYFFESLNSPYKEYNYIIENNDTIEKVLKKYKISNSDIQNIANEIIKRKLSSIFAGTEIKIVTKREAGENKIVSLFYPINEITTIEIKREKNQFYVNKTILELKSLPQTIETKKEIQILQQLLDSN
jgi:hypothetical protein